MTGGEVAILRPACSFCPIDSPSPGEQFRLGLYYVRVLELTPKRRHVHFEVLAPRRRKNQAPDRRWLPRRRFLLDAVPCGRFERAPSGELVWVEPAKAAA